MDRSIQQPVGDGIKARNLYDDVVTIQELLNDISIENGGPNPPLKVDGVCGHKTKTAIQNFQLKHFGWKLADARVDPGGATLKKMNQTASAPEFRSMGFRLRRFQPDSEGVSPSQPQIFHVQYLEFALRRAIYTFSTAGVQVNPSAYRSATFRGEWNAFITKAPMSIRDLGCKALINYSVVPAWTPWGPPDDYYKFPNHSDVLELYLKTGTVYVGVGFQTSSKTWGKFTYSGEPPL
jgi:Putative peptidoglycan binding domain